MNRCGIRRFDKHRQTSERPTDPVLHQEQQQRLSALLQERNAQDIKGYRAKRDSTNTGSFTLYSLENTFYQLSVRYDFQISLLRCENWLLVENIICSARDFRSRNILSPKKEGIYTR